MLRRIFGPKKDEIIGGWRKLHNEEIHNFLSSPNIIRIIKSRRVRWAEHIARIEANKNACICPWWEVQKERDYWEDLDVYIGV
jgi:hypothetical protein